MLRNFLFLIIIIQQVAFFFFIIRQYYGYIDYNTFIVILRTYSAIEFVIEPLPILIIGVHVEFFFGRFRTNFMIDASLDPKMPISQIENESILTKLNNA